MDGWTSVEPRTSEGWHGTDFSRGGIDTALDTRLSDRARRAAALTRDWLLERQDPRGFWVGELEGDTILESEYILLLAFLGRHASDVARKAARYVAQQQLPTGGWAM